MAVRTGLVLLLVAWAAMAVRAGMYGDDGVILGRTSVADVIDMEELLMESEAARRNLAVSGAYISYAALMRNNVPCKIRGHSYYTCRDNEPANPYRRGCTRVTHCARVSR